MSLVLNGAPLAFAAADEQPRAAAQTLTLMFENDLFGDSDAQYTNGLKASWLSPDLKRLEKRPGVPAWLLSVIGRLNAFEHALVGEERRQFNLGFALGQMMYTPDDTQATTLVAGDRPYAGWLYGALSLVSKTDSVADTFEIQAGIIGPVSLAEDAQKFVHDARDLPLARGWEHQLDNEPGVVLFYERKWRLWREQPFAAWAYDVIVHTGIALGNVHDYLALGAEFRVGWNLPHDFGTALIRPGGDANAPSIASAAHVRARRLGVYAFAAFGGRAVARDLFLDGNTFSASHSVDSKPFVGDALIGASVVFRAVKLSYVQVFRSREFAGQQRAHNFGSACLSISF